MEHLSKAAQPRYRRTPYPLLADNCYPCRTGEGQKAHQSQQLIQCFPAAVRLMGMSGETLVGYLPLFEEKTEQETSLKFKESQVSSGCHQVERNESRFAEGLKRSSSVSIARLPFSLPASATLGSVLQMESVE
jgi:hypothetical protein